LAQKRIHFGAKKKWVTLAQKKGYFGAKKRVTLAQAVFVSY